MFIQDNDYYLCETVPAVGPQRLDDYEADERFTLEFVDPARAIAANRRRGHGCKDQIMCEREAGVLELLLREGHFKGREETPHGTLTMLPEEHP